MAENVSNIAQLASGVLLGGYTLLSLSKSKSDKSKLNRAETDGNINNLRQNLRDNSHRNLRDNGGNNGASWSSSTVSSTSTNTREVLMSVNEHEHDQNVNEEFEASESGKIKEKKKGRSKMERGEDVVRFQNGVKSMKDVLAVHSDLLFDLTSSWTRNDICVAEEKESFGDRKENFRTIRVENRVGAASCIVGAVASKQINGNNELVSVMISSDSFKVHAPDLLCLKALNKSVVLNVACRGVNERNLNLFSDVAAIELLPRIKFCVLFANTPEEVRDFAIVASMLSKIVNVPVANCFDGLSFVSEFNPVSYGVNTLKVKESDELVQTCKNDFRGDFNVSKITKKIFAEVFDEKYQLFEFHGKRNVKHVMLVYGPATSAAIDSIKSKYSKQEVAVVVVRMLHSFSQEDFVNILPENTRRICIIDYTNNSANATTLCHSVAMALHNFSKRQADVLEDGNYKVYPTLISVRINMEEVPEITTSIFEYVTGNLLSPRPELNFVVNRSAIKALMERHNIYRFPVKDLAHDPSYSEFMVWENDSGLIGKVLFNFANTRRKSVQLRTSQNKYKNLSLTELRCGDSEEEIPFPQSRMSKADCVLSHVLNQQVVNSVKPGSTILLFDSQNVTLDQEVLVENLSDELKTYLLRNEIKLFALKFDSADAMVGEIDAGYVAVKALFWLNGNDGLEYNFDLLNRSLTHQLQKSIVNDPAAILEKFKAVEVERILKPVYDELFKSNFSTSQSNQAFGLNNDFVWQEAGIPKTYDMDSKSTVDFSKLSEKSSISWSLIFKDAFRTSRSLKPSEHDVHTATVTMFKRLTPEDYERNIFHIEFDISKSNIKYEIGDALGVFGENDDEQVDNFIREYGLDPDAVVKLSAHGKMSDDSCEFVSVKHLLLKKLDLFGKVQKKFYVEFAQFAKSISRYDYLKLMHTGTDDTEQFKLNQYETFTYAHLLLQHHKTCGVKLDIADMIRLIPPIKARHYSIASSQKLNPTSVHLLVVAVDWVTPLGRKGQGQCTRFLKGLKPGKTVVVDIQKSVLRMPTNPKVPIVMAGLGTGMAPFRAFIQTRYHDYKAGKDVGNMILYFGARHKAQEWLYGLELENYEKQFLGKLKLALAWSRDQKHKVYIQHKIREDSDSGLISDLLGEKEKGWFYLCGPTWPVPDVRDALAYGLTLGSSNKNGEIDIECIEKMKEEGRYILEVY